MLSNIDKNGMPGDMPPWMKELRLRRRSRQLHNNIESPQTSSTSSSSSVTIGGVTVQQPSSTSRCRTATSNSISCAVNINKDRVKCNNTSKMVQERPWIDHADQLIEKIEGAEKGEDSDSSEELRYGPGIVSKLKNRYLSLTLREATTKNRPSILNLRKATSLEHILDDYEVEEEKLEKDEDTKTNRLYERHNGTGITKNITNRYSKHVTKKTDMKRARSVEIISSLDHDTLLTNDVNAKRESLHEEMLIIEGNDKTCNTTDKKMFQIEDNKNFSNNIGLRLNRPKKIQPMMDEKEKPHADIVKQTKKIFERPELRTKPPQCTGEVAAKVAEFKTIIDSTKASNKKPPIKQKPHVEKVTKQDRPKVQIKRESSIEKQTQIGSPIPPLRSPIKEYKPEVKENTVTSLPTEPTIPDVSKVATPTEETNGFANSSLSETPDLILHSSHNKTEQIEHFLQAEKDQGTVEHKNRINLEKSKEFDSPTSLDNKTKMKTNNENQNKIKLGNSIIYSFSSPTKIKDHLPKIEASNKMVKSEHKASEVKNNEQQVSPSKPKQNTVDITENDIIKKNTDSLCVSKPLQQNIHSPKSSPKSSPRSPPISSPRSPPKSPPRSPPKSSPTSPKSSPTSPKSSPTPPKSSPSSPKSPTKNAENGVSVTEPLKVEINGSSPDTINNRVSAKQKSSEPVLMKKQPPSPVKEKNTASVPQKQLKNNEIAAESKNNGVGKLSDKVIEKNLKNAPNLIDTSNKLNGSISASTNKGENGVLKANEVPNLKKKRPTSRKEPQNSLVFDFTSRKDVPDYIGNDRNIKPKEKIERPKPGEGGIIILPGATLDESLVDDDEDWKKLLECPPSPCNVTFTNDNILIEGRSSLKKLKKPKMTIRFIEAGPEVFEYPSETSLLDDNHTGSVGHAVPSLSGSTLANYTPKSAFQEEEFQLGMKPSLPAPSPSESKQTEHVTDEPVILQEAPILFSAGTNSDILF